jgi:tetratricopeptide (TPR) repeat protein
MKRLKGEETSEKMPVDPSELTSTPKNLLLKAMALESSTLEHLQHPSSSDPDSGEDEDEDVELKDIVMALYEQAKDGFSDKPLTFWKALCSLRLGRLIPYLPYIQESIEAFQELLKTTVTEESEDVPKAEVYKILGEAYLEVYKYHQAYSEENDDPQLWNGRAASGILQKMLDAFQSSSNSFSQGIQMTKRKQLALEMAQSICDFADLEQSQDEDLRLDVSDMKSALDLALKLLEPYSSENKELLAHLHFRMAECTQSLETVEWALREYDKLLRSDQPSSEVYHLVIFYLKFMQSKFTNQNGLIRPLSLGC